MNIILPTVSDDNALLKIVLLHIYKFRFTEIFYYSYLFLRCEIYRRDQCAVGISGTQYEFAPSFSRLSNKH